MTLNFSRSRYCNDVRPALRRNWHETHRVRIVKVPDHYDVPVYRAQALDQSLSWEKEA